MPVLESYDTFGWDHPESGSVYAALTHAGASLPESTLMGIGGGITFAYFAFHYEGHPPQINLLTRNTFDPLERLLSRLGVVQDNRTTTSARKAVANLTDILENGQAAVVWADANVMPYSHAGEASTADTIPLMQPLVVYGFDVDAAQIADRAVVPLTVPADVLTAARGSVKKERYRVLAVSHPDDAKLADAVTRGIWDCIKLYTETPPPGPNYKKNFGLDGIATFANYLTDPKARRGWTKTLLTEADLYSALTSAYEFLLLFRKDGAGAERRAYADFLDHAAEIIERPVLRDASEYFRVAADGWDAVGARLLPDDVPLLREARDAMTTRHRLFRQEGASSTAERRDLTARLDALREEASGGLGVGDLSELREHIAEAVRAVHVMETTAVQTLVTAMN